MPNPHRLRRASYGVFGLIAGDCLLPLLALAAPACFYIAIATTEVTPYPSTGLPSPELPGADGPEVVGFETEETGGRTADQSPPAILPTGTSASIFFPMLGVGTGPLVGRGQIPVYEPGVYAFEDYGFEDPGVYSFLKGAELGFKWRDTDLMGWGYTDPAVKPPPYSFEGYFRRVAGDRNGNGGQTRPDGRKMKIFTGIGLHDGEHQRPTSSGQYLGDQSPSWVYTQYGVTKIAFSTDDGRQWQFPLWTDGIDAQGNVVGPTRYLDALERTVRAFAQDYDGDPRLEGVFVGGGIYGEGYPYPWDRDTQLTDHGKPMGQVMVEWGVTPRAWETYISLLNGLYMKYFRQTPVFYSGAAHPRGGPEHTRRVADDAFRQGMHMAAHYLAAEPDTPYFALPGFEGYYERWSWVRDYVQDAVGVPERRRLWAESGETYTDEAKSYWQVLMALDKRADYLGVYREQSRNANLAPSYHFFNEYAGRTSRDTPGVWVAFRKESGELWQPQRDGEYAVTSDTPSGRLTRIITTYSNYGEWLTQLDPEGTTVGLWNVGGKEGKFARRTDVASGKRAFYLNVDDDYAGPATQARFNTSRGGIPARISVTYLDAGLGRFDLLYDDYDSNNALAGRVAKRDTGNWATAVFDVPNAYFGGRMTGGADLRVEAVDEDVVLHMVEVRTGFY
ncbi:MAG: hypothetical protein HY675_26985 [Chloroflexi bacterium]|nr:hypothetical protein [Chloroflexota bacterium]